MCFDEAGGLLDDRINRLAVDAEGDLWVATERGVVEREGDGFALRGLLDRHVFALAFAEGAIHAGVGRDSYRWDGGDFVRVAHPGDRPQDFVAAEGRLVVATAEGLAARDPAGAWTLRTLETGLTDDWVTAVAFVGDTLVAGTYARGLQRMSSSGRVEVLREDLWVNAGALVPLGAEDLAVGTLDDGLWLFRGGAWTRVGTREGLPDDDVTAVVSGGDGLLWVATRGGLALLRVGP